MNFAVHSFELSQLPKLAPISRSSRPLLSTQTRNLHFSERVLLYLSSSCAGLLCRQPTQSAQCAPFPCCSVSFCSSCSRQSQSSNWPRHLSTLPAHTPLAGEALCSTGPELEELLEGAGEALFFRERKASGRGRCCCRSAMKRVASERAAPGEDFSAEAEPACLGWGGPVDCGNGGKKGGGSGRSGRRAANVPTSHACKRGEEDQCHSN